MAFRTSLPCPGARATLGALRRSGGAHDGVDHGDRARRRAGARLVQLREDHAHQGHRRADRHGGPARRPGAHTPPATATSASPTPTPGTTTVVNTIPVYTNSEDGLQTVTLDPDFETNKWVYLYYAPRTMTAPYPTTTPTGSAPNTLPAGADDVLLGPVEGLQPALPLQVGRRDRHARPGDRAGDHQGRGPARPVLPRRR